LVIGLLLVPAVSMVKFAAHPLHGQQVNWRRSVLRCGFVGLLLFVALAVPLPHRVTVPAMVDVQDTQRVYVSAPGTLVEALAAGSEVAVGEQVARLENLELNLEVERLRAGRNTQRLRVQNLERRRFNDAKA